MLTYLSSSCIDDCRISTWLTWLWFKEGQSVSWHQTQTLGAIETASICLNALNWYISYNVRGRCGAGNNIKGWQGDAGKMAEGSQNLLGLDQFSQSEAETWTGWDGDATETAPYLSVCPHHLSSVMALPHLTLCLVPNTLLILTFRSWQLNPGCSICFSTLRQIASANLSDGWFPEKIWEAGSPKPWHQAPHQWIIMTINITRKGVWEKKKNKKPNPREKTSSFSISGRIHTRARAHVFTTLCPRSPTLLQGNDSWSTTD